MSGFFRQNRPSILRQNSPAATVNEGVNPPVWRSGNCPGGDEWNNQFLERFRGAVRCL